MKPLPNHLFTRDTSCWIYNGVSINPMAKPPVSVKPITCAQYIAGILRLPTVILLSTSVTRILITTTPH
jgi:hypothetical protein